MKKNAIRTTCALLALIFALGAVPVWAAEGKVNVNSADAAQLALLPRVGPAVSQRIVEFREANGGFESLEDLMLVRGIGEKTFELIRPYVATSGETTLTEKVRASDAAARATEDAEDSGSR